MAYDKVVDSSVLDAGLKQIADAIREKGGTSDNLAFPAGMAEAIAAIEAGGGAEMILGREYMCGSFTLAEDTTGDYEIADLKNLWGTASYKAAGFMFREPSLQNDDIGMWCGAFQKLSIANESGSSACSVGYAVSTSGVSTAIKNGGVKEYNGKILAKFTTSYIGYAGETYNWLILRYDKAV